MSRNNTFINEKSSDYKNKNFDSIQDQEEKLISSIDKRPSKKISLNEIFRLRKPISELESKNEIKNNHNNEFNSHYNLKIKIDQEIHSLYSSQKLITLKRFNTKNVDISKSHSVSNIAPLNERILSKSEDGTFRKCRIIVTARIRPLNNGEIEMISKGCGEEILLIPDKKTVICKHQDQVYKFDYAFGPASSQLEVYNQIGSSTVKEVLQGYNGTILAYGQTGSGKTYTMFGDNILSESLRGMIPRSASQIFDYVAKNSHLHQFEIKCSMVEIYQKKLRDLLSNQSFDLKIKESKNRGIYIEHLTEVNVKSESELIEVIEIGGKNKTISSTRNNSLSSRSHTIFFLEVCKRLNNGMIQTGKLNLVDLAGSEKVSKTGAEGIQLEEAKKINLSLSALGNVIHSLMSRKEHIPYRDSKLTRILQDSLGGNFKTSLIVTCSLHSLQYDETMSTLKFGQRVKTLETFVGLNIRRSDIELLDIIKSLKKDLNHCRSELEFYKRSNQSPASFGLTGNYSEKTNIKDPKNQIQNEIDRSSKKISENNQSFCTNSIFQEDNEKIIKSLNLKIDGLKIQIGELNKENGELKLKLNECKRSLSRSENQCLSKENELNKLKLKGNLLNYNDFINNCEKKKENLQIQILNSQVKALSVALEDSENECLKLTKERKNSNRNNIIKKFNLNIIQYIENHIFKMEIPDEISNSLQEFQLISEKDIFSGIIQKSEILLDDLNILSKHKNYKEGKNQKISEEQVNQKKDNTSKAGFDELSVNDLLKLELIEVGIQNQNFVRAFYILHWKLFFQNIKLSLKSLSAKFQRKRVKKLEKYLNNSLKAIIEFNTQINKKLEKIDSSFVSSQINVNAPPIIEPKINNDQKDNIDCNNRISFHKSYINTNQVHPLNYLSSFQHKSDTDILHIGININPIEPSKRESRKKSDLNGIQKIDILEEKVHQHFPRLNNNIKSEIKKSAQVIACSCNLNLKSEIKKVEKHNEEILETFKSQLINLKYELELQKVKADYLIEENCDLQSKVKLLKASINKIENYSKDKILGENSSCSSIIDSLKFSFCSDISKKQYEINKLNEQLHYWISKYSELESKIQLINNKLELKNYISPATDSTTQLGKSRKKDIKK